MSRKIDESIQTKWFLVNPTEPIGILLCCLVLIVTACQGVRALEGGDVTANADQVGRDKGIILEDNEGTDYNPRIDPTHFVDDVEHPYFTLTPGNVWIYEGEDTDGTVERIQVEVTEEEKTVMGIAATVVRDRVWSDEQLVEDTYDWFAQDKEGNVWYLGEAVDNYENGVLANHEGSWEAGVEGAKPGIIMPAQPQVGDTYRQEFWRGEAEDMGEVLSLQVAVNTQVGSFQNCLQTKDWTPLEPDIVEHKFYCAAVGNVVLEKHVAGDSGQVELVEFQTE